MSKLRKSLDIFVYLFIVPFGVVYVFPRAFLLWELQLGIALPQYQTLDWLGATLMKLGGALATWCAVLKYLHNRDSISPLERPTGIVTIGPYRLVRHPMMWSLNLVLLGEVLAYSSPMIALWLLIWIRFAVLYIDRYEEPYLRTRFGERYTEYCRQTPRWWPVVIRKPQLTNYNEVEPVQRFGS